MTPGAVGSKFGEAATGLGDAGLEDAERLAVAASAPGGSAAQRVERVGVQPRDEGTVKTGPGAGLAGALGRMSRCVVSGAVYVSHGANRRR